MCTYYMLCVVMCIYMCHYTTYGPPLPPTNTGLAMLTRSIDLEHRAAGVRVFGFQPGTTDTDMQVIIRASGINPVSRIPREQLTPAAYPARAIVYLCTQGADDLAGREFGLRDEDFRRRIGLGA